MNRSLTLTEQRNRQQRSTAETGQRKHAPYTEWHFEVPTHPLLRGKRPLRKPMRPNPARDAVIVGACCIIALAVCLGLMLPA